MAAHSSSAFHEAVTATRTPRDADIYVTNMACGGTRFDGFRCIDARHMTALLASHGKRCVFRAVRGAVVMESSDGSSEAGAVLDASRLASLPLSLTAAAPVVRGGAVDFFRYHVPEGGFLSGTVLGVLAHPTTVRAFLRGGEFQVLVAVDRKIARGLVASMRGVPCPAAKQRSSGPSTRRGTTRGAGKRFLRSSHFFTATGRATRCRSSSQHM